MTIIIGHRGQAGSDSENTLASLQAGIDGGADSIHADVRLTRDEIPILFHDASLKRTHGLEKSIASLTYARLKDLTGEQCPPRLDVVLDKYFGRILLNLELRSVGSGRVVGELIANYAGKSQSNWDNVLVSSFKVGELFAARRVSKRVNVALLQGNNPFAFIGYHRFLQFTAVGFHRLHTNKLALAIAQKASIFTFAYTVDRPEAARRLIALGFDGIMTDYPHKMRSQLASTSRKKSKK